MQVTALLQRPENVAENLNLLCPESMDIIDLSGILLPENNFVCK